MKTLIIILLTIVATSAFAQQIDTRKFIEVTGSAEMNIQPDEVKLEIVIGDNKKVGAKKLDDVEKEFKAILSKNNINPESIEFDRASNWYWWQYWRNRNQLNSMTVKVTLGSKTDILKLVKDLNKDWVSHIAIVDTDHKDLQRFRKDVKIQAIKAAKEKANYLLESVGEKIGSVLSVEEIPGMHADRFVNQAYLQSNVSVESVQSSSIGNVAEIKLRYEIKVKFEIQ